MLGFTKKRFFITLGLSVGIWYFSVLIQGFVGINAPLSGFFSGSMCKLTGFPLAQCVYKNAETYITLNIISWFLIISLLTTFLKRR